MVLLNQLIVKKFPSKDELHHYCHLLQHTHFIYISCICVHLHLLQHSCLKTRKSIKALSCHLKLSSLKTRKEQKDGGYKFRIQ
ncbi:hypothetical protein P8452_74084 [Trifolium repens]|nr:hypothetical protein P8452_74084 [Trifolium repens]